MFEGSFGRKALEVGNMLIAWKVGREGVMLEENPMADRDRSRCRRLREVVSSPEKWRSIGQKHSKRAQGLRNLRGDELNVQVGL
jgi:hypothetical protein